MDKLIITAALTGNITMPTQTPYLPISPEEIARETARAADAGAASVHLHARNLADGRPTSDLEVFRSYIAAIQERSRVIICTTTGGALGASREERISAVSAFKPELATLNMGSISFSLDPIAERYKDEDYKYPWERELARFAKDSVFKNTFADLEYFLKIMHESGTKPECEAYDVGHIYNIAHLAKKQFITAPVWMQFVTGLLGGIGSTLEDILHMKHTADRLLGAQNYHWSVIGVGYPYEFRAAALAIMLGGHVRVGLEDNIYVRRGVLAKSNAELVEKAVRIAQELDREIATPDEAREILGLPVRSRP